MHFTYKRPEGDLQQGDILSKSDSVVAILRDFHPYYASNEDYSYLMILTQTCDLERRRGQRCKSRYITLCAVRPFETLFKRELQKHQRSGLEMNNSLCSLERRYWLNDFLKKLYNNNLEGYFYLAAEPELGISKPHVAFLSLSVPIKSEHYDSCLAARITQLEEIFQAKLGWLVGDVYSRVATPDWAPNQLSEDEFNELVDRTLDQQAVWVDHKCLALLRQEQDQRRKRRQDRAYTIPSSEVYTLLAEYAVQYRDRKQRLVRFFVDQTSTAITGIDPLQLRSLSSRLLNNQELDTLLS